MGTWCDAGELFIVPLAKPWPFGVCKALSTTSDGKVVYQWYTPDSYAATKPFKPMWVNGLKTYAANKPQAKSHKPYTGTEAELEITQEDIAIHGFTLTKGGCIPDKILDICSQHPDIAWARKKGTANTKGQSTGLEP